MKYFIDSEFSEDGRTIDLISLAIIREDGREFYAESSDVIVGTVNPWVRENVIPQLWSRQPEKSEFNLWSRDGGIGGLLNRKAIASLALGFVAESSEKPEFWGYYSAYDWVVFCQLFGAMIDLPKGWPMFCRDIIQECKRLGNPALPPQGKGEHHALLDARWNAKAHAFLKNLEWEQQAAERSRILVEYSQVAAK